MRDLGGNIVPFEDTANFYDLFDVVFELGTEFSTIECLQYGDVVNAQIICKVKPTTAGTQTLDIYDNDGLKFKDYPTSVTVLPSIFKKVDQSMITFNSQTYRTVNVSFDAHDSYGTVVE